MTEPKSCCHDYFSVCDVLERKAIKGVVSAEPTMTVRDAAARMLSAGVGSLLVLEGPRLVGIITERDVVRIVRDADDAAMRLVHQVMSRDVFSCGDDVSVHRHARAPAHWCQACRRGPLSFSKVHTESSRVPGRRPPRCCAWRSGSESRQSARLPRIS